MRRDDERYGEQPNWYQHKRGMLGDDVQNEVWDAKLKSAQQSGSRRTVLGTIIPTVALTAQTQGDVGPILPVATGLVVFGVAHILINNVMGYSARLRRHWHEAAVDRLIVRRIGVQAGEESEFLSDRIRHNVWGGRSWSAKHFAVAAGVTAAMSIASSSSLGDKGMQKVQEIFNGRNEAVQVDVEPEVDTTPRPVVSVAQSEPAND